MGKLMEMFLGALFPEGIKCIACEAELWPGQEWLCAECRAAIKPCAGLPAIENTAGFCAGLLFVGPAQSIIHTLKYYSGAYCAPFLASCIQIPQDWEPDAVVPVPLHKSRLVSRGYNQSALLGAELAKCLGIPLEEGLLTRVKQTPSQTRLSAEQRRKNLKGAFEAAPCAGKKLLLVDDVRTTGGTIAECAKTLLGAGAELVYAAAACAAEIPAVGGPEQGGK